ncbi:hypothetical protein ACHAPX_004481 [Trichoderma viride]
MGDTLVVVKTLVIPAVISLILFLILTFVVVPIWRHYRVRYSQYLPIDAISEHTTGWRYRITNRLIRIASAPLTWRRNREVASGAVDLEEGEELGEIDDDIRQVLEAIARSRQGAESTRRLSRELEEGFIDDSDSSDSD